jgi:2-methylcitrate dehydratase PrpD
MEAIKGFDKSCDAVVFGSKFKASAPNAALINGTTAHSFELDDWNMFILHPGAVTIPVALALSELVPTNGKRLIEAIVAGYEVSTRISKGINPIAHRLCGWHGTATCGSFGSAATASKIMGLNEVETAWALGLAGSTTFATYAHLSDGAMSKRLHPGMAAHNGIISAFLAHKGFTGPIKVVEAEDGGLFQLTSKNYSFDEVTDNIGEHYFIIDTSFKPYASCRTIHGAIECALRLRTENQIDPLKIDKIYVGVCSYTKRLYGWICEPKSILSAQFSIPISVSIPLIYGAASFKEYARVCTLKEKAVLDLARKVKVCVDPQLKHQNPSLAGARVVIKMKGGVKYECFVDEALGFKQKPMTWVDLVRKFKENVNQVLGTEKKEKVISMIADLEKIEAAADLCRTLQI